MNPLSWPSGMGSLDLKTALASCSYYPVAIDLGRRLIWFAELDREMYRSAGFLVPKQARMSQERYGFNLDDVLLHDLNLPIGGAPSHYIFISALCCSTLLARLLERVPGCFALKEPSILGQLGMLRYRPRKPSGDASSLQQATLSTEDGDDDAKHDHSTAIPAPLVVPAEAGIHSRDERRVPAFAGPTSPYVTTALGNWRISSGIAFTGSATSPSGDSGTYEWAQVIGTFSGTAVVGSTTENCGTTTGLDTRFPYTVNLTPPVTDSPYIGLDSARYSKQTVTIGAAMYLMWNPETSVSDIAAPLGDVSWQAHGDATFSNNNWSVQSDSNGSALAFQASTSVRPYWTSVFNMSKGMTCQ